MSGLLFICFRGRLRNLKGWGEAGRGFRLPSLLLRPVLSLTEGGSSMDARLARRGGGPKGQKCKRYKTVQTKRGPAKRCASFK